MTQTPTPGSSLMRLGLAANAALSLLVGGLFLVGASAVGDALGVDIDGWIRLFGAALVGHAVILAWARQTQDPAPWTRLNLAMVGPYPLLMVVLAFTVIEPLGGRALVLLDGVLVGSAAALQYLGLRRVAESPTIGHATA